MDLLSIIDEFLMNAKLGNSTLLFDYFYEGLQNCQLCPTAAVKRLDLISSKFSLLPVIVLFHSSFGGIFPVLKIKNVNWPN